MPLLITGYFLGALAALALLAFPRLRQALGARIAMAGQYGARRYSALERYCGRGMRQTLRALLPAARLACRRSGEHRGRLLLASALVVLPPLLVALGAGVPDLWFSEYGRAGDRHIEALLAGEQLTPPLPLPPAVFVTREVERLLPEPASASRDWQLLDGTFRQRLLTVIRLMRERHGYELILLEGYRSPARQDRLASLGPQVTRAGAMMSYHQYGLAADIAFVAKGRIVIDARDPWATRGYRLYGELSEALGLTWGGRWTMRDLGHVELRRPGVLGRAPHTS